MDKEQVHSLVYPQIMTELLAPSEHSREVLYQSVASREPTNKVDPVYFLTNYMKFISMVISKGKPSKDTLNAYHWNIEKFLDWCLKKARISPFMLDENHFELYRAELYNSTTSKGTPYDDNSLRIHFSAIHAFYRAAIKQHIIEKSPCENITTKAVSIHDRAFAYYTMDEVKNIIAYVKKNFAEFEGLRNLACIYLMAVTGLRCVEVYRANQEDIDWNNLTMTVHGKGHDGLVYLDESTGRVLQDYLNCLEKQPFKVNPVSGVTPLIVTNATNRMGTRLARESIRWNTNRVLKGAGVKKKGVACHVFRHSCATALYANTRDLRVVQEVLRHRDPEVTSRYAHVVTQMEARPTAVLGEMLRG